MKLVANARMYAVNAAVEALWNALFVRLAARTGLALQVVAHRPPASLEELWGRDDLGAATMCGYPLAVWPHALRPVPIAAPAPAPEPFAGRTMYWTDIAVRADSRFERDEDLAGTRFGWTTEDSQSGYQAPRRHFARRALARGGRFFTASVGPLVTPRRVVESILEGSIDAGPLDAYWHELLRLHEPATAARLRVVARTEETRIPCFVAAHGTPAATRERLADAFVALLDDDALRSVAEGLALAGFERAALGDYENLARQAREVDALGYAELR